MPAKKTKMSSPLISESPPETPLANVPPFGREPRVPLPATNTSMRIKKPMTLAFTFAHFADLHLGALSEPVLRQLEIATLIQAIDKCIASNVKFIIISGDIFDSNLPNLEIVNEAVREFKRLYDHGILLYYVFGSHDYSVAQTSMINILESAGLFIRVSQTLSEENNKIQLRFITDPTTRAKIVGLDGRMAGNEKFLFEKLDYAQLDAEKGFKIFVFHAAIEEMKPLIYANMEAIPLAKMPKRFQYYAGGHIHQKIKAYYREYGDILYPGPIFAGRPKDLEEMAKGEERGFYLVDVGIPIPESTLSEPNSLNLATVDPNLYEIMNYHYEVLHMVDFIFHEFDATGKSASKVNDELFNIVQTLEVPDKVVALRIFGELASGKTSDINFNGMRHLIYEKGAKYISLNRFSLHTKFMEIKPIMHLKKEEIEEKLFLDNIDQLKLATPELQGKMGTQLALQLLDTCRQSPKDNEKINVYDDRIGKNAQKVLKLEEILK